MGAKPVAVTADTGYFSASQVNDPRAEGIDLYVAIGKQKHGVPEPATVTEPDESPGEAESAKEKMKRKLQSEAGKALYKMRKAIVEPVFGQIKECRNFRRFSLRGLENVKAEWTLVCLTHNILKLFRSGRGFQTAAA